MEVRLVSGHSIIDDVETGSPKGDGVDKVNKMIHHEVCKIGVKCSMEHWWDSFCHYQ